MCQLIDNGCFRRIFCMLSNMFFLFLDPSFLVLLYRDLYTFRVMREVGKTLGIPVNVFGNETHMTAIVSMALGKRPIPKEPAVESHTANFLLPGGQNTAVSFTLDVNYLL